MQLMKETDIDKDSEKLLDYNYIKQQFGNGDLDGRSQSY